MNTFLRRARPDSRTAPSGFTLIEIMVVIAIIGLLLTVVAPNVWNKMREANVKVTKAKMTQLSQYIEDYRRHYSKVPDSLEELRQPSDRNNGEPYLDNDDQLHDAWGNAFQYKKITNNKYDIISLGADQLEGGENDDADLHSASDQMVGK